MTRDTKARDTDSPNREKSGARVAGPFGDWPRDSQLDDDGPVTHTSAVTNSDGPS